MYSPVCISPPRKPSFQAAVQQYYLRVDQTKASDEFVADTISRYTGRERVLVEKLVSKYKQPFPVFDDSSIKLKKKSSSSQISSTTMDQAMLDAQEEERERQRIAKEVESIMASRPDMFSTQQVRRQSVNQSVTQSLSHSHIKDTL